MLWFSKVLHISHSILDTSASTPLQTLLTSMHTHCSGLCETHSTSPAKESVVRMDVQQNGHDCGVWSLYALYSRALKRATKQQPARIFQDMDMRSPVDTLCFRFVLSFHQHTCTHCQLALRTKPIFIANSCLSSMSSSHCSMWPMCSAKCSVWSLCSNLHCTTPVCDPCAQPIVQCDPCHHTNI